MPLAPLTEQRLLVCEGPADVCFFRAFLASRNIPGFCIRHTGEGNPTAAAGHDTFAAFLGGLPSTDGFYDLTDLVLVADSDSDPEAQFANLCRQIQEAAPQAIPPVTYAIPTRPNQEKAANVPAPARGEPNMYVLLLPWATQKGSLETLCLKAALRKWPQQGACVGEFARCARTTKWTPGKRAKMRLAALMSVVFRKNPNVAFARIWIEGRRDDPVPLSDRCFDRLERFLRSVSR